MVTNTTPDGQQKRVYPFVPGYAQTICKSQGQYLKKIIVWMDSSLVPPGAGYVAMSHICHLECVNFIAETCVNHYKPVCLEE